MLSHPSEHSPSILTAALQPEAAEESAQDEDPVHTSGDLFCLPVIAKFLQLAIAFQVSVKRLKYQLQISQNFPHMRFTIWCIKPKRRLTRVD